MQKRKVNVYPTFPAYYVDTLGFRYRLNLGTHAAKRTRTTRNSPRRQVPAKWFERVLESETSLSFVLISYSLQHDYNCMLWPKRCLIYNANHLPNTGKSAKPSTTIMRHAHRLPVFQPWLEGCRQLVHTCVNLLYLRQCQPNLVPIKSRTLEL